MPLTKLEIGNLKFEPEDIPLTPFKGGKTLNYLSLSAERTSFSSFRIYLLATTSNTREMSGK
jgi:hypothetical protein